MDPQAAPDPNAQSPVDPLVQSLLAKFAAPPSPPNIIPFQQAKTRILSQQRDLTPPPAPALAPVPTNSPAPQVTDALRAMSPGLIMLAAFGGALSGGMEGTLKAATGFMQGVKQGDAEATKNNLDAFNTHLNAVLKSNASAVDQYKLVFDKYSADSQKLKDELSGIADAEGDTILKYKLEAGRFDEVYKIIEAREKAADAVQNHQIAIQRALGASLGQPQMVETSDGKQVLAQQDKAGLVTGKPGQWVTADEDHTAIENVKGAVSATTAGLPQANQGMASMIANYSIPPLSGYALRSASGQQIMADVQKINPQYNAANYDRIRRTIDDFATGPTSKRVVSLNVAIQHLQVLQDLGDALQSGNEPAINSAKQTFQKQFGEPAPTNFDAVVQIVGKEVVKAIVNGGGGVTERNDAQNAFSRVSSPAQLNGAISSVKKILAGQLTGLRNQYDVQTKDAPGVIPFDQLLLPDTKSELENIGSGGNPDTGIPEWFH